MKHDVLYSPDNTVIKFTLKNGESVRGESDAMVSMSNGMNFTTSFGAGKKTGGIFKNIMRSFLTGESFFTNVFTATDDNQEVLFAPRLEGDIEYADLTAVPLVIQAGSYLASHPGVVLNTKWQGMKSFFSGESMFFMEASGTGFVVLSAFGGIQTVSVKDKYLIDTGHIVAFTAGLSYQVVKAGSGWVSSFLSGEGMLCEFSGQGTVYMQSRNPVEYGQSVGPRLKPVVKYQ